MSGGWRLPVQFVTPAVAGDLVLRPLDDRAAMPGGVVACDAQLEWRSALGLVRRPGVLRAHASGFVFGGQGGAVIVQRRNHVRVRCGVRTAVSAVHRDEDVAATTVDLSVGGMLIEQAAALRIGEEVRFTIALGAQEDLTGTGAVVRATPFGHRAIGFDRLSQSDEARLTRFVFARERESRSAAAYA